MTISWWLMDSTQISIAIIIPFLVSFIAWALTYIIPYIWPDFVSKVVIKLKRSNPKDPIEIGIIINQFYKYDDWKRLTAYKRIKQMFIQKVREIEEFNDFEWSKLEKKVIYISVENLLDKLNLVLRYLKGDQYVEENIVNLTSEDVKEYLIKEIESLKSSQTEFSDILKNFPNAVIWDDITIGQEYIEKYNKEDYFLKIEEVELLTSKYRFIDNDGTMSKEDYLKSRKHIKPERKSFSEILTTFNDFILFMDYPHSNREEFTYRLALGLSNHERSLDTLNNLISEVKGQITIKDYEYYTKERW